MTERTWIGLKIRHNAEFIRIVDREDAVGEIRPGDGTMHFSVEAVAADDGERRTFWFEAGGREYVSSDADCPDEFRWGGQVVRVRNLAREASQPSPSDQ